MSVALSNLSPANNTVNTDGSETLACTFGSFGAYLSHVRIYYRRNGGAWTYVEEYPSAVYEYAMSVALTVHYNDVIDWYAYGWDANEESAYSAVRRITRGPDTVDPTITSVTPPTGNVSPGAYGVTFAATVADDDELANAKLYVDGDLKNTYYSAGAKSRTYQLTKGAHTYRWTAEDAGGNTADTGTVNITVVNVAPTVPSGTITVNGQTGAVCVANLGAIWVSWPAFSDGNVEDTLTYTLEERAAGGSWAQVASGISGLTYEWSPDLGLGAAELRVKANDGTADSAYLTRTGITIVSSQSPNAPTLTSPTGGETWREGETHDVTWTPAAPEHPEGLPCTYEIQFSALGDFSDAVTITTTADDGSYPWTLSTDLV